MSVPPHVVKLEIYDDFLKPNNFYIIGKDIDESWKQQIGFIMYADKNMHYRKDIVNRINK